MNSPLRLVSIMETQSVSGPAKNLIRFAVRARPHVQLHVLTYSRNSGDESLSLFQQALRSADVPYSVIPERGRLDWSVLNSIVKQLRVLHPDIVQTHAPKSHLLLSLLKRKTSARWLAFHHGYTNEDAKMRIYNALNRISLRRADRVATVCAAFEQQLIREGVPRRRISVLHNSIEENWLAHAPAQSRPRAKDAPFSFLCVGRLSNEKGHGYLLSALALLAEIAPRAFHLNVVGTGPARASLEERAKSLGIASRCSFLGAHADVRPFFAEADAFVLPSLSEGSPNVLLEAMASRLPILASAVGGIPELVGDTGMLVPPANPQALASGLLTFMNDGDEAARLAQKAFERVRRLFTPERSTHRMLALYRQILRPGDRWSVLTTANSNLSSETL